MSRIDTNGKELVAKEEVSAIVGAAMEVHNQLGAGFAEAVYQQAMEIKLRLRGVSYERQRSLSICDNGTVLQCNYVADLVCFGTVIVEIKAIRELANRDQAQIVNYLKATGLHVGVLINFRNPGRLNWHRFVY